MISCQHIYYKPKSGKFEILIDQQDFNAQGITAFIGPNGAGKSTLFKIFAGILRPTTGYATFSGQNTFDHYEDIKKVIHFHSWDVNPYEDINAIDLLVMFRKIAPCWDSTMETRLINDLGIPLGRKMGELSRGQRAKVRLLFSLPQKPKLILIDEITNELDHDTRKLIYKLLDEYTYETDSQVFIATNILEDMERYASNIVIMSHGKVLKNAVLEEVKEQTGKSLESIYQAEVGEV